MPDTKVKKERSLGVRFPEVAKQWAQDLNGDVTPFDVLPYSTEEFYWRCTNDSGHVWKATLKSRSVNGPGCRICRKEEYASRSQRKPRKERLETSNLLLLFPEIAEEWDQEKNIITPDKVFAGSPVKYHWKCKKCGHLWTAKVSNRTEKKSGCPNCYIETSKLLNTHPDVAARWHPTKNKNLWPIDVAASDTTEVYWLCPHCGKAYKRAIASMVRDSYCPYCDTKKRPELAFEKSLAYQYPEVAKQIHPTLNPPGLTPDQIRPKSGMKLWWRCPMNPDHPPWQAIIHNRTVGNQGCPVCARLKRLNKNRLDLVRSDIAKEWDYNRNVEMGPEDVTINSAKQVYWICPQGHPSYKRSIASRALSGTGCPICKKLLKTDNRAAKRKDLEKTMSKAKD
jgi:glutaredoxin